MNSTTITMTFQMNMDLNILAGSIRSNKFLSLISYLTGNERGVRPVSPRLFRPRAKMIFGFYVPGSHDTEEYTVDLSCRGWTTSLATP